MANPTVLWTDHMNGFTLYFPKVKLYTLGYINQYHRRVKKCSKRILLWTFWDILLDIQFYLWRDHELADGPETVWSWECKMRKHTVPVLVKTTSKNETDKNIHKLYPINDACYVCILCKRTVRDISFTLVDQRLSGLRWYSSSDVKTLCKLVRCRVEEKCSRQRKSSKQKS